MTGTESVTRRPSVMTQLKQNWLPLEAMIERNLKGRYRNSIVGAIWNILTPALLTLAVWLVFSEIKVYSKMDNYWFYLAIGMFTMTALSNSIKGRTFYNNMNYIKKTSVPRWIVVLADAVTQIVLLLASYVLLLATALVAGVHLSVWAIVFMPVGLVLIFVMCLGCSFLFSTLNVVYNDIGHIMGIISRIAVWLTPVFFSLSDAGPLLRTVATHNPFTYFVEVVHQAMYYSIVPDLNVIWLAGLMAAAFLILGWAVFKHYEMELAEMM